MCRNISSKLCFKHWRNIQSATNLLIAISLLTVTLPLFIVIAILIRIDSKGPVLFCHKRVGQNGTSFKLWKFRTMYVNAQNQLDVILENDKTAAYEWRHYRKLKNDPRITKMGSWLRKTSLDELPQLFNILTGSMNLIGPRPVTKEELTRYYGHSVRYYYLVKPGITGLWQVYGRNNLAYLHRVALDRIYVHRWTLCLDMLILFKTLFVVIKRKGAY